MSKYIVVDVESDGPIIGKHSMVCFGAIIVDKKLDKSFYGQTAPISPDYIPEALSVSGFSREDHLKFSPAEEVFPQFYKWIKENVNGTPTLLSDNNGYDASWMNYYFQLYNNGVNPFGWTSRRIGDLFCGFYNDPHYRWKTHRVTKHTHNPVDDAKGNAEALLYLQSQGFKIKF